MTCLALNLNPGGFGDSTTIYPICAKNRVTGSDKDHDRSRRPGAEDRGWSDTGRVLGAQVVERSGGAVRGLHLARGD